MPYQSPGAVLNIRKNNTVITSPTLTQFIYIFPKFEYVIRQENGKRPFLFWGIFLVSLMHSCISVTKVVEALSFNFGAFPVFFLDVLHHNRYQLF